MELPKCYDHIKVEKKWYSFWLEKNYFKAYANSEKPQFSIVIPPPNVTGSLHMGHALTFTIQDILIRWKRMSGYNTLWLPGTDHAGIATQMLVEKKLSKEKGLHRWDLGREKFLEVIWQWKEEAHKKITEQMKALGASVDWERERFTLDEGVSRAVRKAFVELYKEGLIYRSKRLVNWSPAIQTVLSDLEVIHKEVKGKLYNIKYPLFDGKGYITLSTTRPETMLGDVAVAVHPDDERYKKYIGKKVILPLTDREIPVIADSIAVDMNFGTGAVKITPGHDFNDFETGKRHNLPLISIFDEKGNLNKNVPLKYQGIDRFKAREMVLEDLEKLGLLEGTKDHIHTIGFCQRSGVICEPMISMQYFIKMKPLAEPAIEAVKKKRIIFIPQEWEKVYFNWMYNIQDWCISRQLWWGHQIPVWYCKGDGCDGIYVEEQSPTGKTRCKKCGGTSWRQDEDVLDTWFSSALWPFSTLGWPEKTPWLKTFYPTSVMETGFDIIFFWVARMIMMGLKFIGDVPFKSVYFHAMVRDEEGEKMSKTKGNVIDPLEVIDKYGSDALRFTLAMLTAQGRDIKLSLEKVSGYKGFINKIWNAWRFIYINLNDYKNEKFSVEKLNLKNIDKWILHKLNETIKTTQEHLNSFRFNFASSTLYQFVWHTFCDWYIELSKESLQEGGEKRDITQKVLVYCMKEILKLLHPFIPFVTEEIWHYIPSEVKDDESPVIAKYPSFNENLCFEKEAEESDLIISVISAIRNIRGEMKFSPTEEINTIIKPLNELSQKIISYHENEIKKLARLKSLIIDTTITRPAFSAINVLADTEIYVLLTKKQMEREKERINKEIKKVQNDIEFVKKRLENKKFIENAPEEIVEKEREKKENYEKTLQKLLLAFESVK